MNDEPLEALGVDKETIRRRVAFFESFPETFASHIQQHDRWVHMGVTATALRSAAQFASVVDPQRARSLINRAASHYSDLGLPYGYFLRACFLESDDAVGTLFGKPSRQLFSLVSHDPAKIEDPKPLELVALTYPVQQTYLFFALSAYRDTWKEFRPNLLSLAASLLSAHAVQPIGPQGVPLQMYVVLGGLLHQIHEQKGEARTQATHILAGLTARYAESIEEARRNTYFWQNLLSSVDIVDIEIVGLARCVDRALQQASLEPLDLDRDELGALTSVGRVPMAIALELQK